MSKRVDREKLFQSLILNYKNAYPEKKQQTVQNDVVQLWNVIKKEENVVDLVNKKVMELKVIAQKKKSNLMSFWSKVPQINSSNPDKAIKIEPLSKITKVELTCEAGEEKNEFNAATSSMAISKNEKIGPSTSHAQLKLSEEMSVLKVDLHSLYKRKSLNFLTIEESNTLKLKEKELAEKEKHLKGLELAQKRQQKFREKRKMEMSKLLENNPDLKKEIPSLREKKGRPRLEENQLDLLNIIADIAIHGSAAEDRRRSDLMRSVKTLDDLTEELKKLGYNISRNGVYLRMLPKRSNTVEGKRHIVTVPVMLMRATNDKHTRHVDGTFCTATLNHIEEIAAVLGPRQVFFVSQDDKSRVPIGLTAANKQAPLLMHVEYKVTLPDHDWVIAPQHKLIPSVYAGIVIKENCIDCKQAVTYSGPTFVAIRSGKHSSSNAYSHANDVETLLSLPEFDQYCRVSTGGPAKPVFMFTVDGGPDENPRYERVICVAIHHFIEQNLDVLFIATNAPGRSAFNRVERQMAPLSRELTGIIIPHDSCGTHLDSQGKTIDKELEKENFQIAGESLAEIWNGLIIDNHPVCAKYVSPEQSEMNEISINQRDMAWRAKHVRESQYFTQIVKCLDDNCCTPCRSDYFKVVPQRFLPPPLPLMQTINGLSCPDFPIADPEHQAYSFPFVFFNMSMNRQAILPMSAKCFKEIPYDLYCPSVQNQLEKRICKRCGLYHSSITRLSKSHNKICTKGDEQKSKKAATVNPIPIKVRPVRVAARRQRELLVKMIENGDLEWMDEEDADYDAVQLPKQTTTEPPTVPIISVSDHMTTPWEDE